LEINISVSIPNEWSGLNPRLAVQEDDIQFRRGDGQPLVRASEFELAVLNQHLQSDLSWLSDGANEYDLTIPVEGPTYQGERLHEMITADGQPNRLIPLDDPGPNPMLPTRRPKTRKTPGR
jgi:hypothetical protein